MSPRTLTLTALALAFVAVLLGTGLIEPYGLLHDELYYWACARRPGLGYVDHPPLAPWLLAATTPLLGEGLLGFGLLPALCGAATLWLTALMARRFGAGAFGEGIAGLCVLVAPLYLALFSFYSVNAFAVLFWAAACFLVVELIHRADERLWLAVGAVAGTALLNKHTFALLGGALAVALVATPLRAQLRSPWLWAGGAAALLLASPNLHWNLQHDWPSLDFYRSVAADKNIATSLGDALVFQVAGMNPAAVLVWLPGLFFLLFSRAARPYRPLGVIFLVLLVAMLLSGLRRGDRIIGAYSIVFAAGAAFWDRWAQRPWQLRARWALPVLLLGMGILAAPAAIPLLSPRAVADYFEALGESPEIEAQDAGHAIPLQLLGRLEWERVGEAMLAASRTLPPEERARAVVLAPHWLYASVVEFYGRDRGLPPVVAPHNAYWFWRGDAAGRDVALSIGIEREVLERFFAETRQVGMFRCQHCANWRGDMAIFVSLGPRRPLDELLTQRRYFPSGVSPQLRP